MSKIKLEDIAIDYSRSYEKEYRRAKKVLRKEHNEDSRNLDVSISLFNYIERNEGMTRALLAEKLGVSQAYLCKLINGNANLTLKTIAKYEDILSIKLLPGTTAENTQKRNPILLQIPQEKFFSSTPFVASVNLATRFNSNQYTDGDSIQLLCY